jgi:cobalt-zinc-cadmium efflux system outer membrane protein
MLAWPHSAAMWWIEREPRNTRTVPAKVAAPERRWYDPTMRAIPSRLGVVCIAATAATLPLGCVTYQARPLQPQASAAALEHRRLDAPELRACIDALTAATPGAWPRASWRLDDLTAAAFCDNQELAGARAALATAQAAVVTAGERQEPGLAVTAEYQSNAERGLSPWTVGPAIDVPLTTAGKREIRVARARNVAEAARLDVLSAGWAVRSRVRSALVDVVAGEATLDAVEAEIAAREAVLASLEVQRKAGAISAPEVAAGRAELDGLRVDRAAAVASLGAARAALAAALGVPLVALDGVALDHTLGEPPPSRPAETDRVAALQHRVDVLAALARYEASQDDLRLAIAEQYPDLHLGPGFLWDQGASRWQLGLSLALPLLNRNRGAIGEAEARRAEAAATVEALQSAIVAALDAAGASVASSSSALAAADAGVETSQALAAAARRLLAAGESSRLDVLLAEAGLARARRTRVEAWRSAQQALGALEDALQRPLGGEGLPPSPLAVPVQEGVVAP